MEMFNVKRRDNPSMDNWSDIKKPAFGGPNEKADFDKSKKNKLKEYQRIVERNPDAEGGRFNPNYDSAWKGFTSDIIYRTAKKKSYEPMYSTPTIAVIDAIEEGTIIRFEEFINENYNEDEDKFDPNKMENPEGGMEDENYLEESEDEDDTFNEFEEEEKVDLGYEVDEEQLDKLLEEFGDELQTMITNICETMEMEKSEVCDLLCAAIEKKCNEATDEESDEEGINDND
tara:strand:- start:349 stop:1038 length:690 start_codon:yes stop_codon:yes gene_type:complete